jgi:hypothetical protein
MAEPFGCDDQTGRHAMHACKPHGWTAVPPGSSGPRHTPQAGFDATRRAR